MRSAKHKTVEDNTALNAPLHCNGIFICRGGIAKNAYTLSLSKVRTMALHFDEQTAKSWCRQDSALMYRTAPLELHWWAQATHIFAVIISRLCMHKPLGVLKMWVVTASLLRSHRAYTVFKFVFHFSALTQWPQRAAVAIIALFLRILCVQFSSWCRTILIVYVTTPFLLGKREKIST